MPTTEELILKAKNHDELAMEELLQQFKPKVIAIAREYFLFGADFDDLLQEGMIGLYKAISTYDGEKNHNFGAFASLCIHRRLQNAVKNAQRRKNNPLNTYLPISIFDGSSDSEESLSKVIIDDDSDVEKLFVEKETQILLLNKVKSVLTQPQLDLLTLFLNGENYANMSQKTGLSTKQVDNTLQTIKKKLKSIKGEM